MDPGATRVRVTIGSQQLPNTGDECPCGGQPMPRATRSRPELAGQERGGWQRSPCRHTSAMGFPRSMTSAMILSALATRPGP